VFVCVCRVKRPASPDPPSDNPADNKRRKLERLVGGQSCVFAVFLTPKLAVVSIACVAFFLFFWAPD